MIKFIKQYRTFFLVVLIIAVVFVICKCIPAFDGRTTNNYRCVRSHQEEREETIFVDMGNGMLMSMPEKRKVNICDEYVLIDAGK